MLRRLVTLISRQATIEADRDASKKQAESASAAAKKLMEDQDNKVSQKQGIFVMLQFEISLQTHFKLKFWDIAFVHFLFLSCPDILTHWPLGDLREILEK